MLKVPCAPLNSLLLPPLCLKTMTLSLILPPLGPPLPSSLFSAVDCPDGLVFIWLSSSYSRASVPPGEPCTLSSLTLGPQPRVSALEMFCGGFPSAMTTHSLLLLVRLHFSDCFQPHNFHCTYLKVGATYSMWANLGAVLFHH